MPILYLHDEILDTLKDSELNKLLKACDSKSLRYLQIDETSWQLLPELLNTTFVIKNLANNSVLNRFINNLRLNIARYGASIVLDTDSQTRPELFPAENALITIAFTQSDMPTDNKDMSFYFSLRSKGESLNFIDGLSTHLDKNSQDLSYDTASVWKHLTAYKYSKIVYSQVPATLIEFNNPLISELSLNDIASSVLDNIIDLYGVKQSRSELDELAKCLTKSKKKPTSSHTNSLSKAKPNSKRRHYGKYLEDYLNKNIVPTQLITKSTFHRPMTAAKEEKVENQDQQFGIGEETRIRDRTSFQSFKDLKRILEK